MKAVYLKGTREENNMVEISCENILKKEKENYKMYEYFKANPSVVIAIFTAIVAIGTTLLNLLVFIKEKQYLDYWEINSFNVINTQSNLYYICASVLVFVFSSFVMSFLDSTVEKYYNEISGVLFIQKTARELKKLQRSIQFKHCRIKIIISVLEKLKIGYDENADVKRKEFESIIKKNKIVLSSIKQELEECKKTQKQFLKLKVFCVFFLLFLIQLVLFSVVFNTRNYVFLIAGCESILQVGIFIGLSFLFRKKRKDIRKDAKLYIKEFIVNEVESGKAQILKLKYINKRKVVGKKLVDYFSDESIRNIGIQFVMYILLSLVISIVFTAFIPKQQKNFYILEILNDSYALIYENNDKYIFEKVVIEGSNMKVNTKEQLVVSKDDIDLMLLEYKEFEKVNKQENIYGQENKNWSKLKWGD